MYEPERVQLIDPAKLESPTFKTSGQEYFLTGKKENRPFLFISTTVVSKIDGAGGIIRFDFQSQGHNDFYTGKKVDLSDHCIFTSVPSMLLPYNLIWNIQA